MKFNHTVFFNKYRDAFGSLNQNQVKGIDALLGFIENDPALTDVRWAAYMLATIKHECADRWVPIEEFSSGQQYEGRLDLGNTEKGDGTRFKGRGYVQITGRGNYRKFSLRLNVDLVGDVARALDPPTSYNIASLGMRQGLFTGKSFVNYIHEAICDYRNARRIINGLDRADKIKGYAEKLESALRAGRVS